MKLKIRNKISLGFFLLALGLGFCASAIIFPSLEKNLFLGTLGITCNFLVLIFLVHQISSEFARRDGAEDEINKLNARLRLVVDSNVIGILFWNSDQIIEANSAFCNLLGYTTEEISSKQLTWAKLTPESANDKISATLVATDSNEIIPPFETELISKTKKIVPVLLKVAHLEGQGKDGIGFVIDRTENRKIELKLAAHTLAVEDSNRDLQEFAYVASHDLQEPLRMISSFLLLLSDRYRGKLDKDADEFIGFAVDGAQRMRQLINDLLLFTRLDRDRKGFVKIDTSLLLKKILGDLAIAAQESHTEIKLATLPEITGNPTHMSRLFQNLIENAMKYRGTRTPLIQISAIREGGYWLFSVSDNGIGIKAEFSEKIFRMFQRLHGRDKYSGSGIGLAICRRIVNLHGGRIWVESEVDQGSVFKFTIPIERIS